MHKFFRLKNCCLTPHTSDEFIRTLYAQILPLEELLLKPHTSDALISTLYAKVILTEELLVNTTHFWCID